MGHAIEHKRFADLPPQVRQRLQSEIDAHAQGRPSALAFAAKPLHPRAGLSLGWCVTLTFLCLLIAFLALAGGYGESVHPPGVGVVVVALLAGALSFALKAWPLHLKGIAALPPAAYVFAWDIVDTRDGGFAVHPLRGLQKLVSTDITTTSTYLFTQLDFALENGRMVKVEIRGQDLARQCLAALQQRNQQLNAALQAGQRVTVAALDPFDSLRQGQGSTTPTAAAWFTPLRQSAVFWALVVAVPTGMAAWGVRNLASDNAFFESAMATHTEAALQNYVAQGWRHVDPARAALPRAALSDARKAGRVTALRAVLLRYPAAGLKADVDKEVHAIFEQAFARFKGLAARSDPTVEPFVRELLARLESSGDSAVTVRFVRPTNTGLDRIDARKLSLAPVAKHFGNASAGPREQRMVAELAKGFKLVFPQDVLSLAGPANATGRPVLQVAYEIAPSGVAYRSDVTGLQFVGVVVKFDVTFQLPGSSSAWRSKLQVLPPDRFTVKNQFPTDAQVYAEMADRAFDRLSAQLDSAFFTPDKR